MMSAQKSEAFKVEVDFDLLEPVYVTQLEKNASVLKEVTHNSKTLIFIGTFFNLLSAYSLDRDGS